MTPEPTPNVQQLLAFYLEAGVDCALAEEPVNRLSDSDPVPGPSEIPAPREIAAALTPQDIPRRGRGPSGRAGASPGGGDHVGAGSGADRVFARRAA